MRRKYGQRITQDLYWVPFNGGSSLPLKAQFIYADLTEFVLVLSAPSRVVGRSGFHWGNTSCTVLAGEVNRFSDSTSNIVKETFKNGQNFRHGQFESYVYEFGENSYLACYGRGMQPVNALWPTLGALSNGDVFSLGQLFYVYGRATLDNFIYSAQHIFDHYKKQVSKQEL
uniref:Sigma non-opioid intracellular receptor 1 n=1 Tax=Acrobeloides nanus TaxID=290746 RepID=A0A914C7L8_9BILA